MPLRHPVLSLSGGVLSDSGSPSVLPVRGAVLQVHVLSCELVLCSVGLFMLRLPELQSGRTLLPHSRSLVFPLLPERDHLLRSDNKALLPTQRDVLRRLLRRARVLRSHRGWVRVVDAGVLL